MSRFVYAGIPLLLAAVHSFAIEYECIMNVGSIPPGLGTDALEKLMRERYGVSGALLQDVRDLVEIRNEIIHPVPLPPGTKDNWPEYLRRIKKKGLLNTTGDPNADYILVSQIGSHRLFVWAVEVTKCLYAAIINSNPAKGPAFQLFLHQFPTLFGTISASRRLIEYEIASYALRRDSVFSIGGRIMECNHAVSRNGKVLKIVRDVEFYVFDHPDDPRRTITFYDSRGRLLDRVEARPGDWVTPLEVGFHCQSIPS